MKKVFWIINQYSSTPDIGVGGRSYYLAEELALQGHQVYLITSSFNHLQRVHPKVKKWFLVDNIQPRFNVVWIKVPKYQEAHSKMRVFNWFYFSNSLKKLTKLNLSKPDVVIYSSPSPIGFLGSKYLSNHFKVPFVFEVRDIWPLTLIELGGVSKKHPFIRFMQWIEDKAYKDSDLVISNLMNSVEHMQDRGMDINKFHWIPNGISLGEMLNKQPLSKYIIDSIPAKKFIIGYTGTLGVANATDELLKTAKILSNHEDIHFLLVGNGKEKASLISYAQQNSLNNITFIDAIPKTQVQSMIEHFDVCFIGSQNKRIYKYGVSPNKVPEYLYSGKPIIFSYSGQGDPIESVNAGLTVEAGDPQAIANAILHLYNLPKKKLIELGENGRKLALEQYDYSKLAKKLARIIFD